MKKEQKTKSKWLHLRLSEDEHDALNKNFKKTTCRKLSEYARKMLFAKPVVMTFRNQSEDDAMAELIAVKKELNAVGNNLNQSVHKLHTLDTSYQKEAWFKSYLLHCNSLQETIAAIELTVSKLADKWLQ